MSSVGKMIFGGDSHAVQGDNYTQMSSGEQDRLKGIEDKINSLFGEQGTLANTNATQSQDIQNLFANNLKDFLVKGGQQTPEDIQKASDFVDQTFTNPAQAQMKQQLADLQSNYDANAASMGRSPGLDIASHQAFGNDAVRAGLGLNVERGKQIQQRSNDQFNQGLSGLNAGMQGSNFLNNLGQQAFSNRLGLLNGMTGLADFYQKERSKSTAATTSSPGLFGYLGAAGNAVGSIAKAGAGLGSLANGNFGAVLGQK